VTDVSIAPPAARPSSRRRVAITGVGVVSPLGIGAEATWQAAIAGRSGIGPITRFDTTGFATTFAGEVRDFDATAFIPKRLTRQMDRFIEFAVAAASMAVQQAGLDQDENKPDPERWGVYVGAGLGGIETIEATIASLREKGPRHGVSPYFVPQIIINLAPGQISLLFGCKGPNFSHVSACSTGAHSIGEAAYVIERGDCDVMIAGGTEATITPIGIGGFNANRALSTRNDAPERASRPFDRDRDGFVLSEGAGIVVLEALDRAVARGAPVLAELVGYAANADAHHITAPAPGHEGAQRCMRRCLERAGVAPEQVGYVNAHGTGTIADIAETEAIKAVFGAHATSGRLLVSSTKSMHGHLLGAAGGLEAILTALALRDGVLPPTINLDHPDDGCDLDYIPHEARKVAVEYALSNSFGFGGTNAALLLKRG
jgi:3-oxoacyl-[acyl-carrier-protein] synthase II